MSWSLNIGSIAGTVVRVHITFLLFLGWIFFASWASGGAATAWQSLAFLLLLFACVLAHEFGHIFTARRFGVSTPDVVLLPIGGVARLERIPEEPWEEFLVAIAGPLVNVVIALALVLFAGAHLTAGNLAAVESPHASLIDRLAAVNLFLAVFNMIPAFPMDGGRVLRALLATRLPYPRATHIAATVGQCMALLFGLIGLTHYGSPILIFIALFVWIGAAQESGMVQMRHSLSGIPVSRAMVTEFHVLRPEDTMADAVELTLKGTQRDFPVLDGERVAGVLLQSVMLATLGRQGAHVRVADVMQTDFQLVESSEMLDAVYRRLAEHRVTIAPVSFQGRLVGLVTMDNIGEFLAIQGALGRPRRVF